MYVLLLVVCVGELALGTDGAGRRGVWADVRARRSNSSADAWGSLLFHACASGFRCALKAVLMGAFAIQRMRNSCDKSFTGKLEPVVAFVRKKWHGVSLSGYLHPRSSTRL